MSHRSAPAPVTKLAAETPLEDAFSVLVSEPGFDALAETVRGQEDERPGPVTQPMDPQRASPEDVEVPDVSTERPIGRHPPDAPTMMSATAAALGPGAERQVAVPEIRAVDLARRAAFGHSPSARALVNTSDSVVALAETAFAPVGSSATLPSPLLAPPPALGSRIVSSAASVIEGHTLRSGSPAQIRPGALPVRTKARTYRPANETVGVLHRSAPHEVERVARVQTLRAAGGPGEEATDRAIAQLLSQVAPFFDFEIVLVSAVTGDRTVHRVNRGLPADGSLDQVPRELSFCTHTVSTDAPFVVEDASAEPFFRSSALVRDLGARAYVGMPLRSGDLVLGSLCAISRSPHRIRPEDLAVMGCFSRVAQALVTHDDARLAEIVVEPRPWPETNGHDGAPSPISGETPVLYSAPFMQALLDAQRERDLDGYRVARMDRTTWRGAVARLPASVPAGLVSDPSGDDQVALLLAARHPELSRITAVALDLPGVSVGPL